MLIVTWDKVTVDQLTPIMRVMLMKTDFKYFNVEKSANIVGRNSTICFQNFYVFFVLDWLIAIFR